MVMGQVVTSFGKIKTAFDGVEDSVDGGTESAAPNLKGYDTTKPDGKIVAAL